MKLFKKIQKNKSVIKFGVVGITNTLVDFIVFIVFMNIFGLEELVSQTMSYACGVLNSFFMNRFWTFKNHKTNISLVNQLGKFIVSNSISLTISLVGLNLLNSIMGINVYISKTIVTLFLQVFNYTVYKFIVFKNDKTEYSAIK